MPAINQKSYTAPPLVHGRMDVFCPLCKTEMNTSRIIGWGHNTGRPYDGPILDFSDAPYAYSTTVRLTEQKNPYSTHGVVRPWVNKLQCPNCNETFSANTLKREPLNAGCK